MIKRVGGVKVAFIGATTITTPTIVTTGGTTGVHFTDEADAINSQVAKLQRQGVHAFVAVIHEGGTQTTYPVGTVGDRIHDIAQRLDPAVSVVISGHSHTIVDTRVGNAPGDPGVVLHPGLRPGPPAAGPAGRHHRRLLGLGAADLARRRRRSPRIRRRPR